MAKQWDVLGLGCATVDDLLYVSEYPAPDAKTRVERSERQGGGLTATALVSAARLGARCAYGGQLGHDELSQFVAQSLRNENIDLAPTIWGANACPIHSVILVDTTRHTRNIFYEISGLTGAHDTLPAAELIHDTRVLFIDHYGTAGNIRAAGIARAAGVAVVADLERENVQNFAEMQRLVDHLLVSEAFARRLTGAATAGEAARALWHDERTVVIVTCGGDGCWSVSREASGEARHHPAFAVEPVDTTGCGDVFHGVYAAALAWGCSLDERIRFAAGAAALKSQKFGAQAGAPTLAQLEAFLHARQ